MPLFHTYREGDLLLGIWKADETTGQLLSMLECLPLYEKQVANFAENRKQEWLAVRVLLKTLLNGREKEIAYYPSGRPYLKDGSAHISISHTRGYVAVALHPCREVGMDIEQYGERVRKVAARFVRTDEVPGSLRGDEVYGLLIHWSAKETLFKLIDKEGVDLLRHLRIFPFALQDKGSFEAREYRTKQQNFYRVHYFAHPDFVLTWAIK